MRAFAKRLLGFFNSLRLTVVLLLLAILLIFAATLDQVNLGVWGVQEKYFRSFFVFGRLRGTDLALPVFPGGYLLAAFLLPNLLVAHFCRFRWTWRKTGIWLTHLGLILLLVALGLSGILQRDNQMRLDVGQTRRYTESFRETELAVIDTSDPGSDQVVAIPVSCLEKKETIQHPLLPFLIKPMAYYPNAILRARNAGEPGGPNLATMGAGTGLSVQPAPLTYKQDENNWPTAYVELTGPEGRLGVFLVSTMLLDTQEFAYQGRNWRLALRAERDYLPFTLTLGKFTHDIYPGTDIPKNFASTLRLKSDDGGDDRQVRIYMNNPLRYGGRAFYQAGYANNDRTSVLQVVSNPGWRLPYLACALIALGLAFEFGLHLFRFGRQESRAATVGTPGVGTPLRGVRGITRTTGRLGAASLSRLLTLLALAGVAATLLPPLHRGSFDLAAFGRLPVLADGRLKPFDTIARTGLLMLQGRQSLTDPAGRPIPPDAWLLDVATRPARADTYAVFRIDNPDVLSLFTLGAADGSGGGRFSFRQLQPRLSELDRQADLAGAVDNAARTAFQRAVVDLREHVDYYARLKFVLQAGDGSDFTPALDDPARLNGNRNRIEAMETFSLLRPIPPAGPGEWQSMGRSLLAAASGSGVAPMARAYAGLARAWQEQDAGGFNAAVAGCHGLLARDFAPILRRCGWEEFFNRAAPFTTSMTLYLLAFFAAAVSWLKWPEILAPVAFRLMQLGFIFASAGILARMWLEGRPPVTNLYSSALFIGWGAVGLCLILEKIHRNAVATSAGGLVGFGTLIIAHHLSLSGDTMEMMRAVLDSNFWLSTHVVTVTTGYASTFLAGFLALIYVLRGTLTRSLDRATADSLARMVYGIVCFATFFSFIGTVLGGIWADQSWGRFWGWDPKENGALMIVLWNASILHARWAGMIRQRGLMGMAIAGNIVTAWSWFGTNMLGVGLHSYGFTEAAFYGLIIFAASQLVLIGLILLPPEKWRSHARIA